MADQEADGDKDYRVEQVCCGVVNTIAMMNTGEVFVLGDNTFNQHAIEELDPEGLHE